MHEIQYVKYDEGLLFKNRRTEGLVISELKN